jgi:hypothetical protein
MTLAFNDVPAAARGAGRDHLQLVLTPARHSHKAGTLIGTRTWRLAELATKHVLLKQGIGWGYMPELPPGEAKAAGLGGWRTQSCGAPSNRPAWSAASPLIFDAELLELCSHCRKSALEDTDDLVANLGRREGGSVYESTPTIDFILGADDHLIGIAIHGDEALGLLDLLHQIIDRHGLVSIGGLSDRALAPV